MTQQHDPAREKAYREALQPIIRDIIRTQEGLQPDCDTGGRYFEPFKRHITFIYNSKAGQAAAETGGRTEQIRQEVVERVTDLNTNLNDTPIEITIGFVNMDDINAAGGFYQFFK